jgi:hypothetical protein
MDRNPALRRIRARPNALNSPKITIVRQEVPGKEVQSLKCLRKCFPSR